MIKIPRTICILLAIAASVSAQQNSLQNLVDNAAKTTLERKGFRKSNHAGERTFARIVDMRLCGWRRTGEYLAAASYGVGMLAEPKSSLPAPQSAALTSGGDPLNPPLLAA